MTTKTHIGHSKLFPSRWQRFWLWSSAVAEAIDYDPQVQVEANMKQLRVEVGRLNARVFELEGQHRSKSASAKSDSVEES